MPGHKDKGKAPERRDQGKEADPRHSNANAEDAYRMPQTATGAIPSSSTASSSSLSRHQPPAATQTSDCSSSPNEATSGSSFAHSPSYSPSLNRVAEPEEYSDLDSEYYERAVLQQRQYHLRRLESSRRRPSSAHTLRTTSSTLFAKIRRPLSRSAASSHASRSHDNPPHRLSLARQLTSSDPPSAHPVTTTTTPGAFRTHPHHDRFFSSHDLPHPRPRSSTDKNTLPSLMSELQVDDQIEAAQDVYVWMPDTTPQATTTRVGLRSPPSSSTMPDVGGTSSGKRHGITPHWLKERSNKQEADGGRLWGPPPLPVGTWRKGAVSLKENAQFYIYGENTTLLHPILASRLKVTDIRPVDPTLLQRYNVLGVFSRPLAIKGGTSQVSSRGRIATPIDQPYQPSGDDGIIYIAFPTAFKLQYWYTLLRAYAMPEVYGQPPTWPQGGSYRWQRGIHLHCHDYRTALSSPALSMRGAPMSSSGSETEEAGAGSEVSKMTPAFTSGDDQAELHFASPTDASGGRELPASATAAADDDDEVEPGLASERFDKSRSSAFGSSPRSAPGHRPLALPSSLNADENGSNAWNFAQNITTSQGVPRPSGSTLGRVATLQPGHSRSILLASFKGRKDQQEQRQVLHGTISGSQEMTATSAKAISRPSLACLIYFNDILAARTTGQLWTADKPHHHWFEKFDLKDLPVFCSLRVDVYQDNVSALGGIWPSTRGGDQQGPSTTPSRSRMKLLGSVDLPLETMTRGQQVEGWFPIWSNHGSKASVEGDATMSFLDDECVGELYLILTICEEVVMERQEYAPLQKLLDSSQNFADLVASLEARLLDRVVACHIFDVCCASSTLVARVVQLSHDYDFGTHDSRLLLRGGAVLTRLVSCILDCYGQDWLRSCLSRTLKRVCEEGQTVDTKALDWFDTASAPPEPSGTTTGGSSHHLFVYVNQPNAHAPVGLDEGRAQDGKRAIEAKAAIGRLRELLENLWKDIYDSRHQCPIELRSIFAAVRRTVYEQSLVASSPSRATAAGLQAIGSLVFLRFFCPAIVAPALSGLILFAPDQEARSTLQALSRVVLRLHNKTGDPNRMVARGWMRELEDFWKEQATVYDDFITALCTGPDILQERSQLHQGNLQQQPPSANFHLDEQDRAVHALISRATKYLPAPLHRELLAADMPGVRMGDQAAPFARFATLIASSIDPYTLNAYRGKLSSQPGSHMRNAPLSQDAPTVSERVDRHPASGETVVTPAPMNAAAASRLLSSSRGAEQSLASAADDSSSSSHEKLRELVYACRRIVNKAEDLVRREGVASVPIPMSVLCQPAATVDLAGVAGRGSGAKRAPSSSSAGRLPEAAATMNALPQGQVPSSQVSGVGASSSQSRLPSTAPAAAIPLMQVPSVERASMSSGAETLRPSGHSARSGRKSASPSGECTQESRGEGEGQ